MLKFITLTGADNSVHADDLFTVSKDFPFVEWGILLSRRQGGNPRFPSIEWLDDLGMSYYYEENQQAKFSLHLCGQYVREILRGEDKFANELGTDVWDIFSRVQINTHGEDQQWDTEALAAVIAAHPEKQFIFQLDGFGKNEAMAKSMSFEYKLENIAFLCDRSHGAGIVPYGWPIPPLSNVDTGYAGGLGPDNILHMHSNIQSAIQSRTDFKKDYWIDMETKLRSGDHINPDEKFDMEKCVQVLRIAQPWFNANNVGV